tara:strand:+ start:74 stop:211 length:138 start_codon:yes stop_codon:yes gene_type:complete
MSKLSRKQRKIARAAFPFDKITGADFKKLRAMGGKNKNGRAQKMA